MTRDLDAGTLSRESFAALFVPTLAERFERALATQEWKRARADKEARDG